MGSYVSNWVEPLDAKRSRGLLKYILRIFFAFIIGALAFGLLFGGFLSIMNASLEGFGVGLIAGVVWAVIVSVVIIPLDVFARIKCYRKYGFIDFRVHQQLMVRFDADFNTIFETFQQEFRAWKGIKLRNKDMKSGIIEVETRRSWRSFGEKISVTLLRSPNGKVRVTISSRPRIFTTIDYSKNFENAQLIIQGVKNRLKEITKIVPDLDHDTRIR